jgi:hypothetical protein
MTGQAGQQRPAIDQQKPVRENRDGSKTLARSPGNLAILVAWVNRSKSNRIQVNPTKDLSHTIYDEPHFRGKQGAKAKQSHRNDEWLMAGWCRTAD